VLLRGGTRRRVHLQRRFAGLVNDQQVLVGVVGDPWALL
jgi:hypothetical protein